MKNVFYILNNHVIMPVKYFKVNLKLFSVFIDGSRWTRIKRSDDSRESIRHQMSKKHKSNYFS